MWKFNRKKQSEPEERTITARGAFGGMFTKLGISGRADQFKIATAYAAIRLISNTVAQTAIYLYRNNEKDRTRVYDHPILSLLKKPQNHMTASTWKGLMTTQFEGYGNAYAFIVRKNGYTITELLFIPATAVSIYRTLSKAEPYYYNVRFDDGSTAKVYPDDMLHFKNISLDGYSGLSAAQQFALTFDTAQSNNTYKKTYMDNASQISGVIEYPTNLKSETVTKIRENFGTVYGGSAKAGKTAVIGGGGKYTQIKPISPQDADFIASVKLTNEDIMRIYGVPPPMLGDVSATYANSEQLSLVYQEYTISPIYANFEQELELKLLVGETDADLELQFVPDLSRMQTTRDRAETQALYKREGIYSANEIRSKNGDAPISGGEEITLPLNTAPMTAHAEQMKTAAEPTADPKTVEEVVIDEK